MESRAHRAHGHVSRMVFSGRNADEQSWKMSARERCCFTGLLPGMTTTIWPTSTPASSDGRSSRRKHLRKEDGDTLCSWCLLEVDEHRPLCLAAQPAPRCPFTGERRALAAAGASDEDSEAWRR